MEARDSSRRGHAALFMTAIVKMNDDAKEFLFRLLNLPSPTGFEAEAQKTWINHISRYSDSVDNDAYGNAWAVLNGQKEGLTLMVEAHADEIGFIIQNIGDEGYLYLNRIGGTDRAIARGKRLKILGDRGPVLGVIGNTAIHLREKDEDKIPEVHQLFVDIGAKSRAEVESRGIRVGHPAVYTDAVEMITTDRLVGRAIDNRIGGFIINQLFASLSSLPGRPAATVIGLNAVQEEIGGYGAKMATYRLDPKIALVLDVTHATDSPGIDRNKHGSIKLGGGPSVTHGSANHPRLVAELIETSRRVDIQLQHEAASRSTGTDTDSIFQSKQGIPSALISIPLRYMHSTVEMVDLRDVDSCIRVLKEFVVSLTDISDFCPKFS
jgi:putative aminopeptidase FrvX